MQTLIARHDGPVLHLTLNRPEVRNAMSLTMVRELRAQLAHAEADGSTRVVVLRGAGGHFCAGADLQDLAAARERLAEDWNAIKDADAAIGDLCQAFADTGLATVAVLEGTVMGGGLGLACVVDVVLAGTGTLLRLPEAGQGLVPAQAAPLLVQRLGLAEARRLALTGASLHAEEALALRLVHEVHAAGALDHALADVLAGLLKSAPGAVAATKALMARARHEPAAALVQPAAEAFAAALLGAEAAEGLLAAQEHRKPGWVPQ